MSPPKNVAASVFQRLKNRSKDINQPLEYVLVHYAIERFLYRVSQSEYQEVLLLKGALALLAFDADFPRSTRDIDFLGFTDNAVGNLEAIVTEICRADVLDDGILFDLDSLAGQRIKEQDEYGGVRIRLQAHLGNAHIPLQMDFGFGDAVFPAARETDYPTLLDFPAPRLRVYPPETILAEKIHAMVKLDLLNTRLKDFYDIWFLTKTRAIEGPVFCEALSRTFARRQTALPAELSGAYFADFAARHARQWSAFTRKFHSGATFPAFADILLRVQAFVGPPLESLSAGGALSRTWIPGGGWSEQET